MADTCGPFCSYNYHLFQGSAHCIESNDNIKPPFNKARGPWRIEWVIGDQGCLQFKLVPSIRHAEKRAILYSCFGLVSLISE